MSLKGKTILIIGAGPLQMPAIIAARRLGLRVLATDMDPSAPGFARAHGRGVVSTLDAAGNVAFAKKNKVQGVMTLATDLPLVTVAAVAHALGLPSPTPAAAQRATNKYKMKLALAAAGVPCPKFEPAATVADAQLAAARIGFPVVTKPYTGSASRGVILVRKPEDMTASFAKASAVAYNRHVVIEEFARGRHICVEAFAWERRARVLCVIDRVVSRPPHFVELRHTFPSNLPKKTLHEVEDITVAGMAALGIASGPAHIDMIVTERGPVISEIGARLDGDYKSSHFMPLVFGYSIIDDAIRAAMGETPALFEKNLDLTPRTAACIHYFHPRPGRVKKATGAAAARKMPGVQYMECNIRPGRDIVPFTRSQDRVGVVIATAPTRREAAAHAAIVERTINIEYEK